MAPTAPGDAFGFGFPDAARSTASAHAVRSVTRPTFVASLYVSRIHKRRSSVHASESSDSASARNTTALHSSSKARRASTSLMDFPSPTTSRNASERTPSREACGHTRAAFNAALVTAREVGVDENKTCSSAVAAQRLASGDGAVPSSVLESVARMRRSAFLATRRSFSLC